MTDKTYVEIGGTLVERIVALIPDNPQIMYMSNPFDLLDIKGFEHSDLAPSVFQVNWALAKAKSIYREKKYGKKEES